MDRVRRGLAFLLPALAWVRPIGDDAWLALSGIESLFWAALACMAVLVMRLRLWPLWVACLWVVQEWARGLFPVGGFPGPGWPSARASRRTPASPRWAALRL
ncbi:hypothetical protein GCM10027612_56190 [Microbispora bryophytorum subsp. camponoti]